MELSTAVFSQRTPFSKVSFLLTVAPLSYQRLPCQHMYSLHRTHHSFSLSPPQPVTCRRQKPTPIPPLQAHTKHSVNAGAMEWVPLQYRKKMEMTFCKCSLFKTQGRGWHLGVPWHHCPICSGPACPSSRWHTGLTSHCWILGQGSLCGQVGPSPRSNLEVTISWIYSFSLIKRLHKTKT